MKIHTEILSIKNNIDEIIPLLEQLHPDLSKGTIHHRLIEMEQLPYVMLGAYNDARLVGLCGCWEITKVFSGKQIEIDNFIIDQRYRNNGVGTTLVNSVMQEAAKRNCEAVTLNAYLENKLAHDFYGKFGFEAKGYHFVSSINSNIL